MASSSAARTDSEGFLDKVQRQLSRLLERAQALDPPRMERPASQATPLAEVMQQMHDDLDRRQTDVEARLSELDRELTAVEHEAQALQATARALRG